MTTIRVSLIRVSLASLILAATAATAQHPASRGRIDLPMNLGAGIGSEMIVMEPSMCEGRAEASISWNQKANRVKVKAEFEGLPYRPRLCYDFNPQVHYPFNTFPDCVEEGRWQIWLLGRIFDKTSIFYYDAATGELLGNEHDLGRPEPGWVPVPMPVTHMVCLDLFESDPETLKANVTFQLHYNRILDDEGTGGVYVGIVPRNLNTPGELIGYYTSGGLPRSAAMSFGEILAAIERGGDVALALSYEPYPKPPDLRARDNLMIGWVGVGPNGPGIPEPRVCETVQLDSVWPVP